MQRIALALALGLLFAPASGPAAAAAVTEEEAHAIGVDAYLYFYPLVTMDVTRKQLTNQEPTPGGIGGPMNRFANVGAFPSADMRVVVRPNFDTLYSSGWLDLTKEPMVVSAPDTGGRYYLLPMLDMWTDVFASPGWRTTGTEAGNFLVTPPGWSGTVPDGFTQIKAPTPYVWIIGRTKTDGPADYDAVHKIQAGYKITPLSQWGKEPVPPEVKIDPSIDMKTPPKKQVDTMPAGNSSPMRRSCSSSIRRTSPTSRSSRGLQRIGFEVGKSFDLDKADPAVQKGLASAPEDAQKLMAWKVPTHGAGSPTSWSMNTDTMGVYGNYYLKRAIVTQLGLGANLPEDAIYPLNLADDGPASRSTAPATTPSISTRAKRRRLKPSGRSRSTTLTASRSPTPSTASPCRAGCRSNTNPDGSLDLYFQNESPGADKEANWLPAPKGPYNLTMRLYAPKIGRAHRQMEPAAGDESAGGADRGPVAASDWHRRALS